MENRLEGGLLARLRGEPPSKLSVQGGAELLQVSQPTILEDTRAKIGQLLVIIFSSLVNTLVVHTFLDMVAGNLLEFHQLFRALSSFTWMIIASLQASEMVDLLASLLHSSSELHPGLFNSL